MGVYPEVINGLFPERFQLLIGKPYLSVSFRRTDLCETIILSCHEHTLGRVSLRDFISGNENALRNIH